MEAEIDVLGNFVGDDEVVCQELGIIPQQRPQICPGDKNLHLNWEGHQWIAKCVCFFHEKINDSSMFSSNKFICNLRASFCAPLQNMLQGFSSGKW